MNRYNKNTNPREYFAWQNMKTRCNNPNYHGWDNYGGRGITYCSEWRSFVKFFLDMGKCPEGLELERLDNNKGYDKANCVWATESQQSLNRRVRITSRSKVAGVHWCDTYGVWLSRAGLHYSRRQLYRGLDFFEAVCARKSWEVNLSHSELL